MAARPGPVLLSLFFLSGALLLILLVFLGGTSNQTPFNEFYFLEATTQDIAGAPPVTRWTFWGACGVLDGRNQCPQMHVAYTLDPMRNFAGSDAAIPDGFVRHARRYYLMTKFMFTFTVLGLASAFVALLTGVLALCSPFPSATSAFMCFVALLFQATAAALMSGAYGQGREHFLANGQLANIGKASFGMMWTGVFCLLFSAIMFCSAGAGSSRPQRPQRPPRRVYRGEPDEEGG